jgi:hypothetical protein
MANPDHLALLQQGAGIWNDWRRRNPGTLPDLSDADLNGANLRKANLSRANLRKAKFNWADLTEADLTRADLRRAHLSGAGLRGAKLIRARLNRAKLHGTYLGEAYLNWADFRGADLSGSQLIQTDISNAILTGSRVYGISAWDLTLNADTRQENLTITPPGEPAITVDKIKVAQFVYLLLKNEEIREIIDTTGRKGVLLLGRFTKGRIAVLERLREALRERGFVPMVFNFDKPEVKDLTETVRLLAGLSHFVIADITKPKSTPLELQAVVPECMIPFVPIIEKGEEPFAMFKDLWIKHREWVLRPIRYPSVDRLMEVLDSKIVAPAKARFADLLTRKAEKLEVEDI